MIPKKLDGVTQFAGKFDVQCADMADAFDVDFLRVHPKAMRERRQDADLVRGVVAVNVQVRRRLGVALLLRVGEHGVEVRAFQLHPREDVIAGAVDDAVQAR